MNAQVSLSVVKAEPQVRTAEELAYFAGILDGEGTCTVYRVRDVYNCCISVGSTSEALALWLHKNFKGTTSAQPAVDNKEEKWQWQLREKEDLIPLLRLIIPRLIIKSVQARLLLKYCMTFRAARRGRRLTAADHELRGAYCELFSVLNGRGHNSNKERAALIAVLTGEDGLRL